MQKAVGRTSIAAALAAGLALTGASTAMAGYAGLGSFSCGTGSSVSTEAYGNYLITFNSYLPGYGAGTIYKGANFDNTLQWQYAYWYYMAGSMVSSATSGNVSNAGYLSDVGWFCDW